MPTTLTQMTLSGSDYAQGESTVMIVNADTNYDLFGNPIPATGEHTEPDTRPTFGPHPYLVNLYDRAQCVRTPVRDFPTQHDAIRFMASDFSTRLDTAIETYAQDAPLSRYCRVRVPEYHLADYTVCYRYSYSPGQYSQPTTTRYFPARCRATWSDDVMVVDPNVTRIITRLRDTSDTHTPSGVAVYYLCSAILTRIHASGTIHDPEHPDDIRNRQGNYLTLNYDKKHLAYVPGAKILPDSGCDPFTRPELVTGKPVRILKTLFNVPAPDTAYETLNNAIVAAMQDSGTFSLVTGEDIRHYYYQSNVHPDVPDHAGVNQSCMRYARCQRYLDLYVDNPNTCAMLVLTQPDDITGEPLTMGRALIWTTDDGQRFMDRVYFVDDRMRVRFETYARDTLGCVSAHQTSQTVNIRRYNVPSGEYPYMDSLCYLVPDDGDDDTDGTGTLTSHEPYNDVYRTLTSTAGDYELHGATRSYRVTYTRTVVQTVTVYVDAASEDDAGEIGTDYIRDRDIETSDYDTYWEVDSVEID
jgi:hypothetical protein